MAGDGEKAFEEIRAIKAMIAPMVGLMQEFKDLKIKNKVSVESHASLLGLLAMNIKEEVLRDVNSINYSITDSVSQISQKIKSNEVDTLSKFEYFQNGLLGYDSLINQVNESIGHIRSHLNKFYDKFDEFRKDLEEKPSNNEFIDVKQKIRLLAYNDDLESLKNEVYEKASKKIVEKLNLKIKKFDEAIQSYVEKSNLDDIKHEIRLQIEAYIDMNCMLREDFMTFKDIYQGNRQRMEDDFKGLIHKMDSNHKNLKEGIKEIKHKLEKKPWKKDIERIDKNFTQYTKYSDFKNLEVMVYPTVHKFEDQVELFSGKISEFELIVLRYDEILLQKASKDDIKLIKSQLASYTTLEEFKESNEKFHSRMLSDESDTETLENLAKSLDLSLQSLASKFEQIKKENKDAANVAVILQSIKEQLLEKVDKIDFYSLVDTVGMKVQFDSMCDKVDALTKQVELGVVLNHTLCRTLISSGESTSTLLSQRQDIYRKMTGLVSWVTGEEPRVKSTIPWRGTPTVRPELYLYKEDSLKNLPRSARNQTARIKMRPKRFTPKPDSNSIDLPNLLGTSIL